MRELLYNFKENDIAIESSAGSLSYEALFDTVSYTHLTLPTICSV